MVHDSEESNKIWYTHNMKEHTPAASELLNYCFSFLLSISCSVAVCQLIINMMMMMMVAMGGVLRTGQRASSRNLMSWSMNE